MTWTTTTIGLVGAFAVLSGAVVLGRAVGPLLATAGRDSGKETLERAGRALVGVALLTAGAVMLYVALVLGGHLAPG